MNITKKENDGIIIVNVKRCKLFVVQCTESLSFLILNNILQFVLHWIFIIFFPLQIIEDFDIIILIVEIKICLMEVYILKYYLESHLIYK